MCPAKLEAVSKENEETQYVVCKNQLLLEPRLCLFQDLWPPDAKS